MVMNTFYVKDAYINTTIYDESIASPREAILPKRLTILQPIFSSKGPANKILDYYSSTIVKSVYGNDMENLKLYGQGGINLVHGMNGGAAAEVCRLLPNNATTASVMLKLILTEKMGIPVYQRDSAGEYVLDTNGEKVQAVDDNDNPITVNGLKVKIAVVNSDPTSYIDRKITSAVVETVKIGPEPEEGAEDTRETVKLVEYQIPIFKLVYNGPGKCGNDMGFSLDNNFRRDDAVADGRRYKLQLWEKDSLGIASTYGSAFNFSLNPDARLVEGAEVYENLQYVFTKKDTAGNERIVQCSPYIMDNWETISTIIAKYTDKSPLDIDILNCIDKDTGLPYDQFYVDPESPSLTIDDIYYLRNGSDGSLQVGYSYMKSENGVRTEVTVDENEVETTKKSLLRQFFYGNIDPSIFDERLTPSDIVVDANYDFAVVKPAMLGKFRDIRPDIMVLADIGTEAENVEQSINLMKAVYGMVDGSKAWSAAVILQHGYTTDRALPLHLTATYDYIYGLARCYGINGTFSVFSGYFNGLVATQEFTFYPYKDEKDTMLGPLRKQGCIYAMEVFRGKYRYMSEDTMYSFPTSKLKSFRNGMVIGDAVRLAKDVLIKYCYDNDGAAGAIRHATTEFNERVIGRYPANIGVSPNMYQTENDKLEENCTCDLIYTFPGMIKTWTLNIRARRGDN